MGVVSSCPGSLEPLRSKCNSLHRLGGLSAEPRCRLGATISLWKEAEEGSRRSDPQGSGEGGAFLAPCTEAKENVSFCCLNKAQCWDRPPTWVLPQRIPVPGWLPAHQRRQSCLGLSSTPPPSPACSKSCLPPTGRFPEQPGLGRVKNCSAAGKADLSPVASAASAAASAVPSPTFAPPPRKETAA